MTDQKCSGFKLDNQVVCDKCLSPLNAEHARDQAADVWIVHESTFACAKFFLVIVVRRRWSFDLPDTEGHVIGSSVSHGQRNAYDVVVETLLFVVAFRFAAGRLLQAPPSLSTADDNSVSRRERA